MYRFQEFFEFDMFITAFASYFWTNYDGLKTKIFIKRTNFGNQKIILDIKRTNFLNQKIISDIKRTNFGVRESFQKSSGNDKNQNI